MPRGRDKFDKYKTLIYFLSNIISVFPKKFVQVLYGLFQNKKGILGIVIRYILIRPLLHSCGDNVSIHPNVFIFHPEKLDIGSNVSIHPMSYIDAVGEISIGDDVSIAHGTTILSSSHKYDLDVPIKDQGLTFKKTFIHNNVWIGAKATILYGLTLNSGSIIGANSVVTKNIEKNAIVGGSPAKVIKFRNEFN